MQSVQQCVKGVLEVSLFDVAGIDIGHAAGSSYACLPRPVFADPPQ